MRKSKSVALFIAALFLAIVGCERENVAGSNDSNVDASADIRVVTLSPHLAELMFAAEAGNKLVGISAYTDYPPEAIELPIISDAFMVDQEQLALLKPDLLLAWKNGTPAHVIDQLRESGFRVEVIQTDSLDNVATAIELIGQLTGSPEPAKEAAERYRRQMRALADRYSGTAPINVFYQISSRPLYTVNGVHYISELLTLCGGRNIFDDLGELAPMVDVEAVISRNPEAMLAAFDSTEEAFDVWDRWPDLTVNRYGNRFFVPSAEIGRATPRLIVAGEAVCEALEIARHNRRSGEQFD